MNQEFEDW